MFSLRIQKISSHSGFKKIGSHSGFEKIGFHLKQIFLLKPTDSMFPYTIWLIQQRFFLIMIDKQSWRRKLGVFDFIYFLFFLRSFLKLDLGQPFMIKKHSLITRFSKLTYLVSETEFCVKKYYNWELRSKKLRCLS